MNLHRIPASPKTDRTTYRFHRLLTGLLTALLTTLPALVHAEDTDIYFGGISSSSVHPNILLILDTSTSMENRVISTPPRSNRADEPSRLEVMQDAVRGIIENINDVNIGLMRFSRRDGGAVLFPIAPIDAPLTDYLSEDADRVTIMATLGTSSDDAVQTGNTVTLDDNVLEFNNNTTVGIRFPEVNIPQGATIESARITFNRAGRLLGNNGPVTIAVRGERAVNAPPFAAQNRNISKRNKTAARVTWSPDDWATSNDPDRYHDTAELQPIVQQIVNRGGWQPNNAMSFIFKTSGQNRPACSSPPSSLPCGPDQRQATAYDSPDLKQAPWLTVTYRRTTSETRTVRDRLLEIVDGLIPASGTPIVTTLHEAARYWTGGAINYGQDRGGSRVTRLSHPASYCEEDDTGATTCNGTTTTDFGVVNPFGCTADDLNSPACLNRRISGTPAYLSPFRSSCQSSYQVLLTDGLATHSDDAARTAIPTEFLNGATCVNKANENEECGVELAEALFDNDQDTQLPETQNVTTFTVAFNLDDAGARQFLEDMAVAGSGSATGFYSASNSQDLLNAFNTILSNVQDESTAFAAPAIATNQFNSLESRDAIYFGMFTPARSARWFGNIKRYQLCLEEDPDGDGTNDCTFGEVLDARGGRATDPTTDQFLGTAQSFWSTAPDGSQTTEGGAGEILDDYTERVLYTNVRNRVGGLAPPGTDLETTTSDGGYKITASNWTSPGLNKVRRLVCRLTPTTTPQPAANNNNQTRCEDRMLWMLGKAIAPEATDPSTSTHWSIYDVLHSAPAPVTYGGRDSDGDGLIDTYYDKVFVGTNDGMLHMLDAATGKEDWAFIPQGMLVKQSTLFNNVEYGGSDRPTAHVYGIDSPPTIRMVDENRDGVIDPTAGDFVHLYVGNRRGGNRYYALDVTPTQAMDSNTSAASARIYPTYLWGIKGEGRIAGELPVSRLATSGFRRLAQTWSQPVLADIRVRTSSPPPNANDTAIKTVLIFGGGYDERLDGDGNFSASDTGRFAITDSAGNIRNAVGNAVFIVDADEGELLLSITGGGPGATGGNRAIRVDDMNYSVPAPVTVFDSDGDGVEDRIYFADTGGQVFRVDLGNDIRENGTGLDGTVSNRTVVGRLAAIATPGTPVDERRFFTQPIVVQVQDFNYSDAANGEFDYVLIGSGYEPRPLNTQVNDRFYGFRDLRIAKMQDTNGDNLADGYPARSGAISGTGPIGHGNAADLVDITQAPLATTDTTRSATGWYYDFDSDTDVIAGEKVIRRPRVLGGVLLFSSYRPGAGASTVDECSANVGLSHDYNWNILSGAAALDWDGDGDIDADDRAREGSAGVNSGGVPIYTDDGVLLLKTTGAGLGTERVTSGVPRFRTYWHDGL